MNNVSVKIESMNDELRRDLGERAAQHAALADVARLRIVDLLGAGDRSSSELQSDLGVASNLLAHHLGVLERAGLVRRTRSEADRRRSYVQLLPSAHAVAAPGRIAVSNRVVFVCTANSARSQLAAALWQQASAIPAVSAGTRPADSVAPGAVAVAERHHLKFVPTTPVALQGLQRTGDLVISVCDSAHEKLGGTDLLHWSVPDPVRVGTDAAFDAAFEELATRIDGLAPRLAS